MKNIKIDRGLVLDSMISHETLTVADLAKQEALGTTPDIIHLEYLLEELHDSGHLQQLPGVTPLTYTITKKGIEEGVRLRKTR
jgi:hypothetical protein